MHIDYRNSANFIKVTNKMQLFIHLVVCLTTGPKPLPK